MIRVSLQDAERRLPQLVAAALDGEDVVILDGEDAAIRLAPELGPAGTDGSTLSTSPEAAWTNFGFTRFDDHDWME
jgi:antitoxin (DNA-binding transcriptional repressor) of toxin-antitoxin stability system